MLSPTTALVVAVLLLDSRAFAQQAQYTVQYPAAVNFTKLFTGEVLSPEVWSAEDWSGVTTFARATPLRCFGVDSAVKYDVAILGECF